MPVTRLKMMARWPPSTLKMLLDKPYTLSPPATATFSRLLSCWAGTRCIVGGLSAGGGARDVRDCQERGAA